jgi:hypothetical protein
LTRAGRIVADGQAAVTGGQARVDVPAVHGLRAGLYELLVRIGGHTLRTSVRLR